MPKVSVIVPNYNHALFLRPRMNSIFAQTFQDFELILLDDCSTDESRSILREYASDPRVRVEFNEVNSGSTFKQWNKGVRLAQGRYVWIAESDDYADPQFLEKLVARLDAEPSAVLAYCRSWRVSERGETEGFLDSYLSHLDARRWTADFSADGREECRKYLVHCNTVQSASSVLFRKDVYCGVGGADEKLVLCGDWKTWVSMALTGGTILHAGDTLNYCRLHGESVSGRTRENGVRAAEALQVVRWILERVTPDEGVLTKVWDELAYVWIPPVLDARVPTRLQWRILKNAAIVYRGAFGKLIRPGLTAIRLTLARGWRSLRASSPTSQ